MKQQVRQLTVDNRLIADAFWRMTCMAFCTGVAVSVAAAGIVLLIAGLGTA